MKTKLASILIITLLGMSLCSYDDLTFLGLEGEYYTPIQVKTCYDDIVKSIIPSFADLERKMANYDKAGSDNIVSTIRANRDRFINNCKGPLTFDINKYRLETCFYSVNKMLMLTSKDHILYFLGYSKSQCSEAIKDFS